jgi:excisionase family DNA binding protein
MKKYVNCRELAESIGVDPRTIRHWCRTGRIPFLKVGGAVRFDSVKIEQFLESRTRNAHLLNEGTSRKSKEVAAQ